MTTASLSYMTHIVDAIREIKQAEGLEFRPALRLFSGIFGFQPSDNPEDLTCWYQFQEWYRQYPGEINFGIVKGPYAVVLLKVLAIKHRAST